MTPRQELDALIDLFAPELQAAFLAAVQDLVDSVIIADVIKAIERGDPEAAFKALGYSDAALRPLNAAIERAYETGGVMVGRTFPKYLNTTDGRGVFRFDVRNVRAEAFLRDRSSSLITRIGEDTRVTVMNTLRQGMQDGRNPRNVALDIVGRVDPATKQRMGGVVGLTTQQEAWVRNYRQKLVDLDPAYKKLKLRMVGADATVDKAIRDGKPLSVETIDKLTTKYKDNALKHRGEMIGRTEAIGALNAADYEATKQAIDMGAAKPEAVKRFWDSAGDRRVRHTHAILDGKSAGLDEAFVSSSGARMMFPGDTSLGADASEIVACRCRVRNKIDWFNRV